MKRMSPFQDAPGDEYHLRRDGTLLATIRPTEGHIDTAPPAPATHPLPPERPRPIEAPGREVARFSR
ncbi:hypothetical protein [Nonomuraea sp. NPDC049709]|uniref:hypothetical protein n=1 Tax=Nonomuraea sp. NPDC049709 TaxID=3154736 RepID=UPI0034221FAF